MLSFFILQSTIEPRIFQTILQFTFDNLQFINFPPKHIFLNSQF
jgi:hypothetical protein